MEKNKANKLKRHCILVHNILQPSVGVYIAFCFCQNHKIISITYLLRECMPCIMVHDW